MDTPWYQNTVTVSTIVIAIATVAYVIISVLLWKATKRSADITQKIFEASHRPYIGIDRIDAIAEEFKKGVDLTIANFGTVPAKDLWEETTARAGNEIVHNHKSEPTILCPGGAFISGVILSDDLYYAMLGHRTSFVITVDVYYKGLGDGGYHLHSEHEYAPERGGFRLKGAAETELSTKQLKAI